MLLFRLQIARVVSHQKAILKMISDQLQLNVAAPAALDASQLVKLTVCLPLALPLFSPFATSLPYMSYLVNTFLPTTTLEVQYRKLYSINTSIQLSICLSSIYLCIYEDLVK